MVEPNPAHRARLEESLGEHCLRSGTHAHPFDDTKEFDNFCLSCGAATRPTSMGFGEKSYK